jgi:hypothetical protein
MLLYVRNVSLQSSKIFPNLRPVLLIFLIFVSTVTIFTQEVDASNNDKGEQRMYLFIYLFIAKNGV